MTITEQAPAATISDETIATLAAAAATAAEIVPGNWCWAGNTKYGQPELSAWIPGQGRTLVMGHLDVERTRNDPRFDSGVGSLQECRELSEADATAEMEDSWLHTGDGEIAIDTRLAFNTAENLLAVARDNVVFEVARNQGLPDWTSAADPRIYRTDIVAVRNPLAEFIAAASASTVLGLVERLNAAEARVAELESLSDDRLLSQEPDCPVHESCPITEAETMGQLARAEAHHAADASSDSDA